LPFSYFNKFKITSITSFFATSGDILPAFGSICSPGRGFFPGCAGLVLGLVSGFVIGLVGAVVGSAPALGSICSPGLGFLPG
jgi:hypothetical protein